ncbi:dihydrolipoyl dehydrogenase [Geopsychrobacter electrodiphilus]|uniref:dihydrolipoyl dehydrogenase n=1 Tax=Geopsychrobacter electrodiphilus TaxID=225196 RepID=UPI00036B5C00|nr:dihydrolipoyl dehydrogenase [Geopsychrobacter electrodiphilus]
MSDKIYDLLIIGAGPGGYVAAIRGAQLGFKVAVIEKRTTLGGVCLNEGCIPSKALLESSEQLYKMNHDLDAHGISCSNVSFDLQKLMARKDQIVTKLTGGIAGLFKKHKIDSFTGQAKILAPKDDLQQVEISGDATLSLQAKRLLLATGSEAIQLPHLPFNGKTIISAREALTLPKVPKKMLVVGGGVIGLEMGSVWSRLGAAVTIVEMLPQLVPGTDPQMAKLLQRSLTKQGLEIRLETKVESADKAGQGYKVKLSSAKGDETVDCDLILVATGRRPQTAALGLEAVGLEPNKQGFLEVDENYQTSAPGIFAIGDLIPGPMLAHKASDEGVVCVERMAGQHASLNYNAIPAVTYTHPEVASVGRSEAGLTADGISFAAGKFYFAASGRALAMEDSEGFIKVLADPETGRIHGIHIIGPHASELIAEATTVINFGGSVHDMAVTCHAHPTLAEALREAALAVTKEAIHA